MDSSQLTERVKILRKSPSRDDKGGEVRNFALLRSVWMKAEPMAGREYIALQQSESDMEVRFTAHYSTDIRSDDRLEWKGVAYEIIGPPVDVKARREWLEIQCRTAST